MSRGSPGATSRADRVVRSWLHEDRHEDATRVLNDVLTTVDTTPQRRSGGTAWRFLSMNNNIVRVGLAVAAVVVIAIIAINLLPGTTPPGGEPSVSPSVEPTATPEPSASMPASAPPLTQSFTSTLHGYSVSYPEGWSTQAATEPWTASTFPLSFPMPQVDWLYDPILEDHLFLAIASQAIGDSTPEDWIAEQMASDEGCGTATEPIAVDGATGLIGASGCDVAVVTTADRGYWIQLFASGDDPPAVAPYDRAWFEEVLATVQLHPEDAVD
jgi:hypothetical protein